MDQEVLGDQAALGARLQLLLILLILLGMLSYLVLQDPLYGHLVQVVQEVLGDQVDLELHHNQR